MFRLPSAPMRVLGVFGAASLVYFTVVDLLTDAVLKDMPGREYLLIGLDIAYVLASVLVLRIVLDKQYRRLRRVNEALETRYETRTGELKAEIAERTRTEETLRASEQRFRDIAEAASDWLWESGTDFRFRYVSKRFSEKTGLPSDLLLGRSPSELFLPSDSTQPELTTGPMSERRAFRNVGVLLTWNGERRWLLLSGRPVADAAGRFIGYRGTGTDITKRRDRDLASAKLRLYHELILGSLDEGVFGLDREGHFTFINPAAQELLGWRAEEINEKSAKAILMPEPDGALELSTGRPHRFRAGVFRRKDGTMLPVEIVLTPIVEAGEATGAVVAFRDITEQKRAAAQLVAAKERAEASIRAKSSFLAHISHRLRTPLNAIIGFTGVIRQEYFGALGNERYRDYIDDIGQSAAHLSELIEDLADLARIEAGRLELEEELCDVSQLAEEVLATVRAQAQKGGCNLQNNVPGNLPPMRLDPTRFKQVLLNLLSNAIKFTPAGGRVAMVAEMEPDGGLLVRISDTGCGMSDEQMETATRSFGQSAGGALSGQTGTGLGLPLAKQLMELHGGGLSIASQPGQGTVVSLRLPPARIGVERAQ